MKLSNFCFTLLAFSNSALALEYPIGNAKDVAGMKIAAVYLQAMDMEPAGHMKKAVESDIHLEADIHALSANPQGFAAGAWLPYLLVKYQLKKANSTELLTGTLMPMVASDGPHYGDNVKLKGPGKYHVKFSIYPPGSSDNPQHFGRHIDRATGVQPWFKPIELEWEFNYVGVGKKGGY